MKLATAYLAKYPSASFTLRNLGQRLEKFLREEPKWIAPNEELALDMARFEWAQVVAFDDAARPENHDRRFARHGACQTPAWTAALSLASRIELCGRQVSSRGEKARRRLSCGTKRAILSRRCRKPRAANARSAGRNESGFTSSSIATRTCSTTSGSSRRPLPFCRDCRKARRWKKPALPRSRNRPEPISTGPGKSRNGFTTGPRSAGFAGRKNERFWRKLLPLVDRDRECAALARAPCSFDFTGAGNCFSPVKGS